MRRKIFGRRFQGIGWVGLVGSVALGVQVWLVWRSPVPSLDAVRFVRSAAQIDQDRPTEVFRVGQEAPLWIAWLWAVHRVGKAVWGEAAWAWAASVQLAAVLPLLAAFYLVGLLAIRGWGRRRGLLAALLFCTLPEAARLGVDGLSDSLHLLLVAACLYALVEGLRHWEKRFVRETFPPSEIPREPRMVEMFSVFFWFLAGGVFCGLASFVRSEVLVVPVAWAGTCMYIYFVQPYRRTLGRFFMAGGPFFLGLGSVWAAYATTTVPFYFPAEGPGWWNPVALDFPGQHQASRESPPEDIPRDRPPASLVQEQPVESSPGWMLADGGPPSFEPKEPTLSIRRRGFFPILLRGLHKTADVWGYWVGGLALVGLWSWGSRSRGSDRLFHPISVFLGLTAGFVFLGAIAVGTWVGYLESRHLVLTVVCGIGAAGAGADTLGRWLQKSFRSRQGFLFESVPATIPDRERSAIPASSRSGAGRSSARGWLWGVPVGVAVVASCLAQAGGVHGTRLGHRQAGDYLARHSSPRAIVVDTRGWTGLYSGRTTYLYSEAPAVLADPHVEYFVVESAELGFGSRRAQTLRLLLTAAGDCVAVFPFHQHKPHGAAQVEVYRWDAKQFQHWIAQRPEARTVSKNMTHRPIQTHRTK